MTEAQGVLRAHRRRRCRRDRCGGGVRLRDTRRGAQSRGGARDGSRCRRCAHRRSARTTRRARGLGRRTGSRTDGRGRHRDARRGPPRAHPLRRHRRAARGAARDAARGCATKSGFGRRVGGGRLEGFGARRRRLDASRKRRGRAARNRPFLSRPRRERAHRSSPPRRPVGPGTGDAARAPRGRRPSASVGGAGVRLSRGLSQTARTCSHYYHISRADIRSDYRRVVVRFNNAILRKFTKFGGNTKELAHRPSATTKADQAYDALHEMASQAERDRDFGRAGEIREALGTIDKRAVEALQALTTKHGIPETPFIQAVQQPPAAAEPTMAVTAIPLPAHTPGQTDWIAAYRQLRDLTRQYSNAGQDLAHADARSAAISRIAKYVARRLTKFGGDAKRRIPHTSDATRSGTGIRRHPGHAPAS